MLEIILLASGSFLLAMFCVWAYRIGRSWHGSMYRSVKLKGQESSLNVGRERGNVQLRFADSTSNSLSNDSRKPWGW
ncbi:hypothetical protein F3N42_03035 [Marinihelvus fidelis]|uniref:Uncharacterized protein n=1 Tax=Marinihelvus fidelis TaxID=2613842 RepID=A0A5N0TE73_9GAMM|nr:hypothetical protein [Marinihelvus fidelis]KAA9133342.1 hypothetical protein F3N42_03035 [Marinihelvus fidelis]